MRLQKEVNQKLMLGMRPQEIYKVARESLRATLPSDTKIAVDQILELVVDTRNLHLFDCTTEKTLI